MRRLGARGFATVAAVVLAAGCGSGASSTDQLTAGEVPPDDEVVPRVEQQPREDDLVLAFGGDIHFENHLAPLARDPQGLARLAALWSDADLRMANLETAITERGTKVPKAFNFRAPASALVTLANAGADVVTMANNHGVDYGPKGLSDTLAAIAQSPVPVVGIGADERQAFAPYVVEYEGVWIAVLAASQVAEQTLAQFAAGPVKGGIASAMPLDRIRSAVTAARSRADVVVVYLHWGTDYQECPDQRSTITAAALAAAGADVVVGAHSHRVGAAGWLGRSYVAYGLGNFVWWRSQEPDSRTGILRVRIDPALARISWTERTGSVVTAATWQPLLIGRDGIPATPSAPDTDRLHSAWEQVRACSELAGAPG